MVGLLLTSLFARHSGARVSANPESRDCCARFRARALGTRPGMTAYLHQKHTLAVDLLVEQFVGLVRLIDAPVVGEEFVDVDAALDRKPRAVRLDDVGERP